MRAAAPSSGQRRPLVVSGRTGERVESALVDTDEGVFGLEFLPRPEKRDDSRWLQLGQDLEEGPGRQRGGASRQAQMRKGAPEAGTQGTQRATGDMDAARQRAERSIFDMQGGQPFQDQAGSDAAVGQQGVGQQRKGAHQDLAPPARYGDLLARKLRVGGIALVVTPADPMARCLGFTRRYALSRDFARETGRLRRSST